MLDRPTREQRLATAFNRIHRLNNEGGAVFEEWRIENEAGIAPSYDILRVNLCGATGNDEDYGAWNIQTLVPHLQASAGFEVVAKFLSTTNAARHVTITSSATLEDATASLNASPTDDWSTRVKGYQAHATASPMIARRIC